MQAVWNEIVDKTRAFVHDAGFEKVVVGLSGGLDSAVVACIAVEALGLSNVLLVLMPSPHSSKGSVTDAKHLARNWRMSTITIPIEDTMGMFDQALEPFFGLRAPNVTEENIQARIRSVLLMAICNEQNRLLLNTCNKSEDYTGYCTLYGDSCGAVAPIGGLYKTEVYALARWINSNPELPNIPTEIIDKEPSAELSPHQLDTDNLPPYDVLDFILKWYLDDGAPFKVMQAAGHDPALVERVLHLVHNSAYKRAQSPPVIEVRSKR